MLTVHVVKVRVQLLPGEAKEVGRDRNTFGICGQLKPAQEADHSKTSAATDSTETAISQVAAGTVDSK